MLLPAFSPARERLDSAWRVSMRRNSQPRRVEPVGLPPGKGESQPDVQGWGWWVRGAVGEVVPGRTEPIRW